MTILALYISKNFRTGGQKRYLELLIGLAEKNHTIHLFHRRERNFPFKLPPNFILHPLNVKERASQQKAFTKTLREITRKELESLNINKILLFGDSSLLCSIYLKRILGIPLIIAIRNNIVIADKIARKKNLRSIPIDFRNRFREYQLCRYADTLIFQTDCDRDSICSRNGFPLERTRIIPNSLRGSWFLPQWRDRNQSRELKTLIFIGSDHKRKGLGLLLDSLAILKNEGKTFTLELVGDFPRTNLAILPDWVKVLGRLESPLEVLSQADLLIVPSLYDSFPNTVLESLFVGTPVIGSDVAGIKAMLDHEALLFPVRDVSGIVETLNPLFISENYVIAKKLCRERQSHFDFNWITPWENVLISN